ncbi:TPA: hypothetical protein ACH3X1_011903 [Trebouxia sp. C0004]
MPHVANEAAVEAVEYKLEREYAQYASALWQSQGRTAHQLANASEPLLPSCGLLEMRDVDIQARADGAGEDWAWA